MGKILLCRKDTKRAARYKANLGLKPVEEDVYIEASPVSERPETLLDVIYACDPITNLPSGDFIMYLGKDTSPEVRQFIQSQLLTELPKGIAVPEDQQDVLFDYVRRQNEPLRDYVARITEFEKNRVKPKSE